MIAWGTCVTTGQAQFHQPQSNQNAPLGPTVPQQFQNPPLQNPPQQNPAPPTQFHSNPFPSSGVPPSSMAASLENQAGIRSDSTVSGVRSMGYSPNNSASGPQNPDYYSTLISTSGTNELQQGTGLPALPNRSDATQGSFQDNWRSPVNPLLGSSGQTGNPANTWPGQNPSGSPTSGFNPAAPVLQQQPGGEITGTGSRLLANDQPGRQRSSQSVAERQAAITNQFDPYIDIPKNNASLRRGRIPATGQDGFQDYSLESGDRSLSERPGIPTTLVRNNEQQTQGTEKSPTTPATKSEASMDALSWWLMMCSVMANLILFYFLYDSRAKYLNLADDLQSRFFREG
jgi:hypothetical protein